MWRTGFEINFSLLAILESMHVQLPLICEDCYMLKRCLKTQTSGIHSIKLLQGRVQFALGVAVLG